jgi:hypothetical protein
MVTKVGLAGIVVAFCAGLWLIVAPFALRFQPAGAPWVLATQTSVIVGATLAVASFAGFFLTLALHIRALYDQRS